MRAIINGAGVAGTVAALALHKAGIESVILERRAYMDPEHGSWFTVSPNGLVALAAVDALPLVREIGTPTTTNILLSGNGRELGRTGLGKPLTDGTPALTMKRSRLTTVLAAECSRRGIEIRYGCNVVDCANVAAGLLVTCADGTEMRGDLLIGADGVNSAIRRMIDPAAPAARYVGLTNFGGVTSGGASLLDDERREPRAWHMVFGRSAFFGHLVLPSGDVVWFVNEPRPAIGPAERAATSEGQWIEHLAGLFDRDVSPAAALIRAGRLELAADNTSDLGAVPVWHRDRMIVIGDAAHAPAPSSGQGASMAAEDAVVLAQALRDSTDVSAACRAYEAIRRERVERIVRIGARSSSSKTPGAVGRPLRDAFMRLVFRYAVTDKSMAWMFDHRIDWPSRVPA